MHSNLLERSCSGTDRPVNSARHNVFGGYVPMRLIAMLWMFVALAGNAQPARHALVIGNDGDQRVDTATPVPSLRLLAISLLLCVTGRLVRRFNQFFWPLLAAGIVISASTTAALAAGNHALLIGIGRYDPKSGATPLPGVPHDLESAARIASALGVPRTNIKVLIDSAATKAAIVSELQQLTARVSEGSRAMIHFSGHGTRWFDPGARVYRGTRSRAG